MPVIKVGISVSLSGQFQTQGRQALAGLHAWAEDTNEAGGVAVGGLAVEGRRHAVKVVHYDDASVAEGATRATQTLIERDRVDLLFGPYSSGLANAAANVSAANGQVLWNQGGAGDEIYQPGSRVVGILNGAREYLSELPGLLRSSDPSASTLAIVHCSTGAFPRQVSEGLETQAVAQGFTKVIDLEFPPEQSDFPSIVSRLHQADPDLLLVVGRIRHDISLSRALISQWKTARRSRATAVVAAGIARFSTELGSDVDGFIGPSQWEPPALHDSGTLPCPYFGPSPKQLMVSLERAKHSNGGLPIDYPMAQAYAAGLVAQRCLEEAGTPEPTALWNAAVSLDFHTFFGRFRIDPATGKQVGRSVFMVQWQRGRKVVIWPPEHRKGNLQIQ